MPTISQLSEIEIKITSNFIDVILLWANDENIAIIPVRIMHKLFDTFGDTEHLEKQTKLLVTKINSLSAGAILKYKWNVEQNGFADFYIDLKIELSNPKIRKLKTVIKTRDEIQPDRLIYVKGDELYFNAFKQNINPQTIKFIFLKSLFELSPNGGVIKYASIIKQMKRLGIEKVSQKKPASEIMIRNAMDRLHDYKIGTELVVSNARKQGVQFTNPPI